MSEGPKCGDLLKFFTPLIQQARQQRNNGWLVSLREIVEMARQEYIGIGYPEVEIDEVVREIEEAIMTLEKESPEI